MAATSDPSALRRDFITIDGAYGRRQVHFRRGGTGPVVLLLHQSPQSSREMEPLIAAWGRQFTLIAPDSPGYGLSTPLLKDGQPVAAASIDDFARATLEFTAALGLGRFAIYGFHTGASIGVAVADLAPGQVTAVAANGLVVLTPAEREVILRDYLPPLVPRWDGGHMAWLWGRMREQTIFFPWHDRRAATRMNFDVPPADRLQLGLLEFLAAVDHYHVAYRAAFIDQAELRLPRFRVPLLVTAASRDPLGGHLHRIGERSATVRVEPAGEPPDALARCLAHLVAHPGALPPATTGAPLPPGFAGHACHGEPGRQLRVIHRPATTGDPRPAVVLLHPPGSSARTLLATSPLPGDAADVLAPDLPGHGGSDPASLEAGLALASAVTQLADALAPVLAARPGNAGTVVAGFGAAAPVATALADRLGAGCLLIGASAIADADRADWLAAGLPPLTPLWHGGHLLEAWHVVRDGRLFSPWFRRERPGIRPGEPDLDEARLQQDVTDLLRANGAWQALLRDTLVPPPAARRKTIDVAAPPADWGAVLAAALATPLKASS